MKHSSLSVALHICECKSKTLFLIDQMFFEENLKFFDNLNPFSKPSIYLLLRSHIGTAKIQIFFTSATFISKSFERFFLDLLSFRVYRFCLSKSSSALTESLSFFSAAKIETYTIPRKSI
jgi:hypothetical protein